MAVLTVGSNQQYSTLNAAVAASHDGDTIYVQAGTYTNDFSNIDAKVSIVGVGGLAHFVATQSPPNGKGILTANTDIKIDHLEFSGTVVPDGNGAGIRYQGGALAITNSYFHDNQNGILGNAVAGGTIVIDHTEFNHNGAGDGRTHNLYINNIASLQITNSYIHDAVVGHEIKSRANITTLTNNRIVDGNGSASYSIDLPNGGNGTIQNNFIQQGPNSENPSIIAFSEESAPLPGSQLKVIGNTILNQKASVTGVWNASTTITAQISGNHIYGIAPAQVASGPNVQSGNDTLASAPAIDTSHPFAASPWDDIISALGATNLLNGTAGRDLFVGGTGNDTFVIGSGGNSDTIAAFDGAHDAVKLNGYGFSTFSAVSAAMVQQGVDVRLTLGNGETLTFQNMQKIAFTADDFQFGSGSSDMTAPALLSKGPADNSVNVVVGANLTLTFNENVKAGSGNVVIHKSSDGSVVANIAIGDTSQVTFSGATATIDPTGNLAASTHYYVTLGSGVIQDLAGNAYAGIASSTAFDFTTAGVAATHVPYDFNGDGHSDILWQSDSGKVTVWEMNGLSRIGPTTPTADPHPSWHVIGAGNFNNDGNSDILLQRDDGQPAVWLMNGTSIASTVNVGPSPGASWHVKGAGDFNADGKSDILWQNDNGQMSLWLMNGTSRISTGQVGANPSPSSHIEGVGDFNGDGRSDVLWQNVSGQASIWLMNGRSVVASTNVGANPGPSWHVKGAADFNGDGKSDILWQNDSGQAAIWLMNGASVLSTATVGTNPGTAWHVQGAEDFNGDGKADIAWQADNGQPAIWMLNGTNVLETDTLADNPGPAWHIDWA